MLANLFLDTILVYLFQKYKVILSMDVKIILKDLR